MKYTKTIRGNKIKGFINTRSGITSEYIANKRVKTPVREYNNREIIL